MLKAVLEAANELHHDWPPLSPQSVSAVALSEISDAENIIAMTGMVIWEIGIFVIILVMVHLYLFRVCQDYCLFIY